MTREERFFLIAGITYVALCWGLLLAGIANEYRKERHDR